MSGNPKRVLTAKQARSVSTVVKEKLEGRAKREKERRAAELVRRARLDLPRHKTAALSAIREATRRGENSCRYQVDEFEKTHGVTGRSEEALALAGLLVVVLEALGYEAKCDNRTSTHSGIGMMDERWTETSQHIEVVISW